MKKAGSPASLVLESFVHLFGWSVGLGMFLPAVLSFRAGLTDLGACSGSSVPTGCLVYLPTAAGKPVTRLPVSSHFWLLVLVDMTQLSRDTGQAKPLHPSEVI